MKLRVILCLGLLLFVTFGLSALPARSEDFRVCADPDYMPFSNRAGEGFENKIAEAVAKALGANLVYTWASYRGPGGFPEFLSRTLETKQCDVVMNTPYGSREARTTQPYYVSSYVFVFKKSKNYDITSMDSPALKKLKIGFESDTPVEDGLKMRSMIIGATAFDVGDPHSNESPAVMVEAVEKDEIDVLITWEPAIGGFLAKHPDLEVVAVPNARTLGSPERYAFPMSMGLREDDEALQKRLDDVIAKHESELTAILTAQGVKLYTPQ